MSDGRPQGQGAPFNTSTRLRKLVLTRKTVKHVLLRGCRKSRLPRESLTVLRLAYHEDETASRAVDAFLRACLPRYDNGIAKPIVTNSYTTDKHISTCLTLLCCAGRGEARRTPCLERIAAAGNLKVCATHCLPDVLDIRTTLVTAPGAWDTHLVGLAPGADPPIEGWQTHPIPRVNFPAIMSERTQYTEQ